MRVLVLGSGAREHAVAWKFSLSKRISGLYIAPGNAGTDEIGENLPDVSPLDTEAVLRVCRDKHISHVFVGPEQPLDAGIIDALTEEDIPAVGPHRQAARLESSKVFSKRFMNTYGIPTADAREFVNFQDFKQYVVNTSGSLVIKKNGLAAGKGVFESDDTEELLRFGRSVLKDDTLLVEEFLQGWEISVFAITDGNSYIVLPHCADFKKAGEDDTGPNTGGMGAICPVPIVTTSLKQEIRTCIIEPTFRGLRESGLSYKGVVYFGLMITENGPKLLEYNVRFGDPEAQVLLPLIQSDFGNLSDSIIRGTLDTFPLRVSDNSAVGVVIASGGYPDKYNKMLPVTISEKIANDVCVFHASTVLKNGRIHTNGGRCFTVVGTNKDIIKAYTKVYNAVPEISFRQSWYRKDIAKKFFYDLQEV